MKEEAGSVTAMEHGPESRHRSVQCRLGREFGAVVSLTSVPMGMNFNMPDPSMTLTLMHRIPGIPGAEVVVTAHQEPSIGLHHTVARALKDRRFDDPSGRELRISLCHASSDRTPTHRLALPDCYINRGTLL